MTARERTAIVTVPCPGCGAVPGDACRDHAGRAIPPHDARRDSPAAVVAVAQSQSVTTPKARPRRSTASKPGASKRAVVVPRNADGARNYLHVAGADDAPVSYLGETPGPRLDVVLLADRTAPFKVRLTSSAAERLVALAAASADGNETGGVMIGLFDRAGSIVITDVAGPGPRAQRSPTRLRVDAEHDVMLASAIAREMPGQLIELGGWHTHPGVDTRPSRADCHHSAALLALLQREHARLSCFVEIIVVSAADGSWRSPRAAAWVTTWEHSRQRYVTERAAELRGVGHP